ncbi:MAG: dTDP-4-dehydrorhamnose reductase [Candidatus Aminicenantaceae bacterium]
MKIAIIGADGQLGSDLMNILAEEDILPLYYPDFDITQKKRTRDILNRMNIEVLINTAAYHRVDECEDDPERSFLVNSIAVRDLSVICKEKDIILVHFSTDYVFDGKKKNPYTEKDTPNPLSVYATSKLAGEYFIKSHLEKYYIIRTCGLFGEAGCYEKGYNFVDRIIHLEESGEKLKIVNDQFVTPTHTKELAEKIYELIKTNQFGLYHLTNEGQCSWYEFACCIFKLLNKEADIIPLSSDNFFTKAKRPLYSVLENKHAKDIGLKPFSHWKDALYNYMISKKYIN